MNIVQRVGVGVVVCLLLGSMAGAVSAAVASRGENPVAAWNQELARIESGLTRMAAGDAATRDRLIADAARVRRAIEAWLAAYPPAAQAETPWLEAAAVTTVEDVAAELGRLRAVSSRIEQALRSGGDGAFYLGRVDVAVTASANATPTVDLAPIGAVVIPSEELQANNRVALAEALALAPGVSFSRIGQRNETSIYLRGFDIRQVPVFIDGIPVYTPYDGYADLSRFTTFDVAELRVSKGFSSVVLGPNALGGAVNVVSRRPTGRLEGLAGLGAASGHSRQAYVNAGTRAGRWYGQGGASFAQADTFPLSDAFVAVKNEDGGSRENAFREDVKFNVKLGVTARDGDEYAISYVGQRGEKGNPPYAGADTAVKTRYWKWPYWDKDSLYAVTNTNLGRAGYLRGRGYYDVYDNALHAYDDATFTAQTKSSSFKSLYHDHTIGGSMEWGTVLASRHALRSAVHVKRDFHEEHNVGELVQHKEGRIVSAGVEDSITVSSRLSVVAGVGADWQTTSKAETLEKGAIVNLPMGDTRGVNPQLGVFFGVPSGMLRATVSGKTRLPSLKDRYSYKLGTAIPNPELKPERATTAEVGYQGALGRRTSVQVGAFYSRITDLIQRFTVSPNVSQQRNIGQASSSGVEADVRSRVGAVELIGTYTYLHRENISNASVPLTETPVHKAMASCAYAPVTRLRVSANVEYEAGRVTQNESGRLFDVPSFAVVATRATVSVHRGLDLDVTLNNLFDRNYWVADGYPEAGRTLLAGARWKF